MLSQSLSMLPGIWCASVLFHLACARLSAGLCVPGHQRRISVCANRPHKNAWYWFITQGCKELVSRLPFKPLYSGIPLSCLQESSLRAIRPRQDSRHVLHPWPKNERYELYTVCLLMKMEHLQHSFFAAHWRVRTVVIKLQLDDYSHLLVVSQLSSILFSHPQATGNTQPQPQGNHKIYKITIFSTLPKATRDNSRTIIGYQ